MKKIFLTSIFFVMLITVSTKKNQAQCNVCEGRLFILITCYDADGNKTGLGNTCASGSHLCKTNFCPTSY
jgi:hypothetical protein